MERESVIKNRHGLIAEAIQVAEYRVKASDIDAAIGAAITSGELIVGERDRLTTRIALETEKSIDAAFEKGLDQSEAIADLAFIAEQIAKVEAKLGGKMTDGQRDMVEYIITGTDLVSVVEGDAGTGKSTGMEAVKQIAEAKGYKVLGLAPSAQAVESLVGAGIKTITSQRATVDDKFWKNVNNKTVIVLDEAGLVDARSMRNLLERAAAAGARFVVVGDDKQFASVESGRALYQLIAKAIEHERGARLDAMRRGRNEETKALHFAARDNPLEALDMLFSFDKVTAFQSDKKRINALAKEFAGMSEAERLKTLVLTGTNADRIAINTAIRAALGREGGVEINTLERYDFSKSKVRQLAYYEEGDVVRFNAASDGFEKSEMLRVISKTSDKIILERADGSRVDFHPHRQAENVSIGTEERIAILPGERVRFTANDNSKEKQFANGDRGTILAIEKDRVRIQLDKGKEVYIALNGKTPLPLRYGYCQTGHSAQGATAKNVLLHIKSTDRTVDWKSWYTNDTRAAEYLRLFTDAVGGKRLAALRQAISQVNNKEMAHEVAGTKIEGQKREALTYIGPAKGWQREMVEASGNDQAIADALTRAQERFGERLHIQGNKQFREKIVEIAAAQGLAVKFTDKALNDKLRQIVEKPQQRREEIAAGVVASPKEVRELKPTSEAATDKGEKQDNKGSKLKDFINQANEQKRKEEQQQQQKPKHNYDMDHDF